MPRLDAQGGKSDPFVALYSMNNNVKRLIGKTEVIWDATTANFVKQFAIDYYFEETQHFLVEAYDMDDDSQADNFAKQDFMGKLEFTLHEVAGSRD